MIQVKVTRARFAASPRVIRKPASLGTAKGRIRRGLPIHENERAFRRDVAIDYQDAGRGILAALHESGALERVAKDAAAYLDLKDAERRREEGEKAKRRPKKPIGRGGTELGDEHQQELRRIFSRGALGFVADLIGSPVNAFELTMRSTLDENYHDLFDVGGKAARLGLGVSGAFDLRSPAIAETLATRANLLAGDLSDDEFERMLTIIAEEFYLQGEGPLAVARTLEEEFDWLSRERAERIARTETLSVTEEAQWLTYSASGVEWKRWLTTLDEARESHFEAHGQLKAIDEPFEVGVSELMYPGDPDAPPDEICNCRCSQQAVVDESQVFNDRAVWRGDIDPDEFAKDREKGLTVALGGIDDRRSMVTTLMREVLKAEKAEREYVRDEGGRFAETGGGGAGERTPEEEAEIERGLAVNRERMAGRRDRREQVINEAKDLDSLPQDTPAQMAAVSAMQLAANSGDLNGVNVWLEEADTAYLHDAAARKELDDIARPIMEELAEDTRQFLPSERETVGEFDTDARAIAKARELEKEIAGLPRERAFLLTADGTVRWDSHDSGSYHSAPVTVRRDDPAAQNGILVHNHPNSGSLSFQDMRLASALNAKEIRAVGVHGGVYRISIPASQVVTSSSTAWSRAANHGEIFDAAVRSDFAENVRRGEMFHWEANARHQHEVWSRLAKEGLINYEYDPQPAG